MKSQWAIHDQLPAWSHHRLVAAADMFSRVQLESSLW